MKSSSSHYGKYANSLQTVAYSLRLLEANNFTIIMLECNKRSKVTVGGRIHFLAETL